MRALIFVLVALPMLGCDEGHRKREKAELEKAARENTARQDRFRAERAAEAKVMAENPLPTLDQRIAEWISVQDGMFVFRGEWTSSVSSREKSASWYSMPATSPWFVRCDDLGGIHIAIGAWTETSGQRDDGVSSEARFGVELSTARLGEEQCKMVVTHLGRRMQALVASK